jgi:hypothetical protein
MSKQLTTGQRAYEEKRAAKAGVSLEKWMEMKARDKRDEERAQAKAAKAAKPARPGFLSRLIDRARKPL